MKPVALPNNQLRMRQRLVIAFMVMMVFGHPLNPLTSVGQCSPLISPDAPPQAQAPKTSEEIEYEVKAAFIYNFIKFIEWPTGEKNTPAPEQQAPMIIGILGDNPFQQSFRPLLGKTIQNRTIQLVEIPGYQAFHKKSNDQQNALTAYRNQYQPIIQQCNILFICISEKETFEEIISLVHGNPVLTISEVPMFAKKGGMIEFITKNKKVRFEINSDAAAQEGLKIRSQLLGLARKIHKKKRS